MAETPVRRAYQVYLYAVCFVATVVLLVAGTRALLGIVHIALPEQSPVYGAPYFEDEGFDFPAPDRSRGTAELLEGVVLAGLAGGLFVLHWRRAKTLRGDAEPGPAPQTPAE